MRKIFSTLLIAAVSVSMLGGCGSQETMGGGKNATLKVSVFAQEHEAKMYREVIAKFEEANDVKVDLQVAGDQYWPELEASLTANAAPDVFYLGVADVRKRVWADKVEELDALLDVSTLDKIWPEALNLFKYDSATDTLGEGSIYALPKDFSAVAMVYNKALIEKRRPEIEALVADGTLPFFPEMDAKGNLPVYTFTEFAKLCKALTFVDTSRDNKQVYGTHLWEEFTLPAFIWGAGGDYLNEDKTKVLFNTPEFIEGYEGFMKIVEEGGSGSSADETSGYLKFLDGRCAYFPAGTWDIGAFQAIATDEAVNPNKEWFDYDLAPWPISDKYASLSIEERQDKWAGRVDSIGYAVSKNSKNKELAAKLAYLLSADEEIQRYVSKQGGQLPNIVSMAEGEYLTDPEYFPESRKVFVNMLKGQNGRRVPTTYSFNPIWHQEAFVAGTGSVWSYYEKINIDGVTPMSVRDYLASIHDTAQQKLDESIASENELNPNK